jgi:Cu(I)/Ag(I) efflux system membrane protein CusA/SilA
MWSTRVGAEVMKPLAAPVLGGMLSSLAHVLIVTPVLFFAIRARGLPPDDTAPAQINPGLQRRWLVGGALVVAVMLAIGWWVWRPRTTPEAIEPPAAGAIAQSAHADDVLVTVGSPDGHFHQGSNAIWIEFRSATTHRLMNVGAVRMTGAMSMPGMVMPGQFELSPLGATGRYVGSGSFGMAGAWQFAIEWTSEGATHKVSFEGAVQ